VLEHLHHSGHGASYARDALDRAISLRHQRPRQDANGTEIVDVQRLTEADWAGREVLVVGRGPLLHDHVAAVNEYIRHHDPVVIECNYLPEIQCASNHYCAFILLANARSMVRSARAAGKSVIVGYAGSPVDLGRINVQDDPRVFWEPYQIQRDALSFEDQCVIPHDVVSMFCIGQALAHGARRISVVGFDGYTSAGTQREQRMQSEMKEFFALLQDHYPDTAVRSLLKTTYPIQQESIYAHLSSR
jgi:4-hydroxy 2-oxovalerate aldolase